ncbi:hypothetical protein RGB72_01885 [Glutamicibacter protophormiae]|uniref:hypothetical protein n=1 Tax=Kocuria salsicia TaxID=664639 RepID=UPI0006D7FB95|nr:hypothetical protein [Kocuria salsicia]WNB89224.1 hypothetical protein RGB72_01885 [Glutamicibacter protophormiae]
MPGTPAGTAAVACGAFSATMTIGRLPADRVVEWLGSEAVLRCRAAIAAVGALVVSFTPWVWLAVVGWDRLGVGLSGCVPTRRVLAAQ